MEKKVFYKILAVLLLIAFLISMGVVTAQPQKVDPPLGEKTVVAGDFERVPPGRCVIKGPAHHINPSLIHVHFLKLIYPLSSALSLFYFY